MPTDTTTKYIALRRIQLDKDAYALGDAIELTPAQAAELKAIGAIREKSGK
ncbi:MAG TPA: hypothetical protein VKT70_13825 [Stellaceae bacterium]|nr:hypothetical protein [Stellaceae bacterium]